MFFSLFVVVVGAFAPFLCIFTFYNNHKMLNKRVLLHIVCWRYPIRKILVWMHSICCCWEKQCFCEVGLQVRRNLRWFERVLACICSSSVLKGSAHGHHCQGDSFTVHTQTIVSCLSHSLKAQGQTTGSWWASSCCKPFVATNATFFYVILWSAKKKHMTTEVL